MSNIASTADVIRTHARERGDKTAIIQDEFTQTWAELDERSNRAANALAAAEDRVAFLDKNGFEYFEILFGCAKLNAVTVNINWRLAPPEVAWIANDAGATVFLFGKEFADTVAGIRDELGSAKTFVCLDGDDRFDSYESWLSDDASDPGVEPGGEDVAFQLYSSGTTGLPKGVMLSNDNLFALLPDASETWGFNEDMVSLVAMPLFHIGGSGWAMAGMFNGGTSIIVRELDPAGLIDLIGRERVTHGFLVPAVFQFMLMMPNVDDGDYSSLEMLVYGASPITEEVYWRNEEGTRDAFTEDGFFRTGDAGYFDEDGYLYIHDRMKDMIVSGGENVYPAEIENVLMKHPDIADVAVIGVPDDKWGEVGKAMVVKAEGSDPSEADILTYARDHLAGFKIPKSVDFIEAIPRNPTGKMLKKDLRAPFWEGRDRGVN